jgi:hypothetical protein
MKRLKTLAFTKFDVQIWEATDPLHELRRELWTLRTSVTETKLYITGSVAEFFNGLQKDTSNIHMRRTPIGIHDGLLEQANQLHTLVLETFQLLMNIITVEDSKFSIRQK